MCCACDCLLRALLFPINACFLVTGAVALVLFGILRWGVHLLLDGFTLAMQQAPGGVGAHVDTSQVATIVQPYLEPVAYVLLGVGLVFFALGVFGALSTACPSCCRCLGWLYIAVLVGALLAFVALLVVWFSTADARVAAVKLGLRQKINATFQDFWQLRPDDLNVDALAFNFAHVFFKCTFCSALFCPNLTAI